MHSRFKLGESDPQTVSGSLFTAPLVDFAILGTAKSPEFCDLRERDGL